MLIVIPISQHDANLSDAMEKAFEKFPPGAGHNLLVVSAPNAKEAAKNLLNKLCKYFVNSTTETFNTNNPFGWPMACNFYFQQTCYLVPKYAKPTQGWLWLELDSVPLTADWADLLEREYYAGVRAGRRFTGTTEKTLKTYGGELTDDGNHMASVGIYPADLAATCPVLSSIGSSNKPFSRQLKWYTTISKGAQVLNESPIFQNNRETEKYREEDGKIMCDSASRNPWNIHWNNPIADTTVILHGCMDGSLIDLVPADRKANVVVRPIVEVAPERKPAHAFAHVPPHIVDIPTPQVEAPKPQQQASFAAEGPKRPAPQVRTFGQHLASGASKPQVQFDEKTGLVITPPPVQEIPQEPIREPVATVPEVVPQEESLKAEAKPEPRKRPRRMKRVWTPEQRQQAADRMRKMQEEKRKAKELVTA